jgi:GT2 family glycosyltransferase
MLSDCVSSVLQTDYPNYEVVLVDNGSSDSTTREVADSFSKVKLVTLKRNLGYAGGNNEGAKQVSKNADLLVFLNSDVVVDKDWLSLLVKAFSFEKIGAAGPTGTLLTFGNRTLTLPEFKEPFFSTYASGHCLAVKKKIFEDLSGFNENFFMYWEEIDLCFRIHSLGFNILVLPEVADRVDHLASRGMIQNLRIFYEVRNSFYTVYQSYPAESLPSGLLVVVANQVRRALSLIQKHNAGGAFAALKGIGQGLWNMNKATRPRKPYLKQPYVAGFFFDLIYLWFPRKTADRISAPKLLLEMRRMLAFDVV